MTEIRWAENSVRCVEHSVSPNEDCFVCMLMVGPKLRKLKMEIEAKRLEEAIQEAGPRP